MWLRVFENRVTWKIFGPKTDEVTGEWGGLHNEEFYDLYSLPNIIRVVKSRRMRWAWRVACMVDRRGAYRGLVRDGRERDHLVGIGVDGRLILKCVFKSEMGKHGVDLPGLG